MYLVLRPASETTTSSIKKTAGKATREGGKNAAGVHCNEISHLHPSLLWYVPFT